MSDFVDITVEEAPLRVTIEEQQFGVTVEELVNKVTVDEYDPNLVYVSFGGARGPRGAGFFSGSGEPGDEIGLPGDFYIDTDTGAMYGPKTETWPETPFLNANATLRHVFNQNSPSATWLITHALGGFPSVTVVDSALTQVIGEVKYLSETQIQVDFTAPFSGKAYLT